MARSAASAERSMRRTIREHEVLTRRLEREQRAAQRQQEKNDKEMEKLARLQYLEDRQSETDDLNVEINNRIDGLKNILSASLTRKDEIDFASLKEDKPFDKFVPPKNLMPDMLPVKQDAKPQSFIMQILPGAKKRQALAIEKAENLYKEICLKFNAKENAKENTLNDLRITYDRQKKAYEEAQSEKNLAIVEFEKEYLANEEEAVATYIEMILDKSDLEVDDFVKAFRLAYRKENREVVIEYDLPNISIVPTEAEFKYIKSRDSIDVKARKPVEIKALYQDALASITLRVLRELFETDKANAMDTVTFNGILQTIDPSNGHEIRIPVISVRTNKDEFLPLKLEKVDKLICLRNLGAQVSNRPDELQAIRPIVEFNMFDRRFVHQGDVLQSLESRPNLLDLTPTDFEILVSNLFTKMGLDTKLTCASRDGGVDAVAFDTRPILGGKVIIQAKRYKDTVGVSAVRDLFGTMQHEGANKGILVCTSSYGRDAYTFSKDKPIELIDGAGLLYLLKEHAGMEARIIYPIDKRA